MLSRLPPLLLPLLCQSEAERLPEARQDVTVLVISSGSGASRPLLRVLGFRRPFQVRLLREACLADLQACHSVLALMRNKQRGEVVAHRTLLGRRGPEGVRRFQACMLCNHRQRRDRAHQSCATVQSAFPPCGFDAVSTTTPLCSTVWSGSSMS